MFNVDVILRRSYLIVISYSDLLLTSTRDLGKRLVLRFKGAMSRCLLFVKRQTCFRINGIPKILS